MSDPVESEPSTPRQAPRYGEYATPAEVAAARGIPFDERGDSEPVSRLAQPLPPVVPRGRDTRRPPVRQAAPPSGRPVATASPHRADNMVTVLLLVFGIWNTVTSIPSYLDLGSALRQGLELAGYGSVSFDGTTHVVGIVLLSCSFLVLAIAVVLSFRRIRMGRTAVWVPLLAGVAWFVLVMIAMVVVVANTPGITAMLQNHS